MLVSLPTPDNSQVSHSALLARLWRHVGPRRRKHFAGLLLLMVVTSFAEVFSIGAILPYLAVLSTPEKVHEHPLAKPFNEWAGISSPEQLLLPLTVIFVSAALVAGTMRLILLWSSTRVSFATGADISTEIYRRTLYQPYSVHVARNSSELIDGISGKAKTTTNILFMLLNLISSSLILLTIVGTLFAVAPQVAMVLLGGFGLLYGCVIFMTRRRLLANSRRIASASTQMIKLLQEGLGGIRDVLIDGSQKIYCNAYREADVRLRLAMGNNQFLGQSPRFVMEAMGMAFMAILAYGLAHQSDGLAKTLPLLGAMALGAQRLLPALQQAYLAWTTIQGNYASLEATLALLEQPMPDHVDSISVEPMPFRSFILINHVSFRYSNESPWILKDICLSIPRGARVGFMGTTGSGKSTLLDIIMGLLSPNSGALVVDGSAVTLHNQRGWQTHIAHVPQAIYLADSTIEENIALGQTKENIDHERVRIAAKQARIDDIIESWPAGYKTVVGERGIRLSGGQRQRVGIARALYKQADVLVFDEATSALDNETEHAVMQAIDELSSDLTVLIIAHRLTTLKNCTQIVELRKGEILRTGSYEMLATQA